MPQIKQLQTVYWGPFRPDPLELATDGINVFAGMNGVGKTCLLDAIKLMLGVDDLKAKPADYIYASDDDSQRVDKAYLKAVFDNPLRSRRQGRVFADAGWGCAESDNVTAICEVTRSGRRYAIFAGYHGWGEQRPLQEDLTELAALPQSRWLKPRQWSELLARAGVPRALLGVIALKQGETDKALGANPEQLLRQMLELTGKQQTLDDFRAAKAKLVEERGRYEEVLGRLESERRERARLGQLVARHREFERDQRRVGRIDEVELPLARRRALDADLAATEVERDQRAGQLDVARRERSRLDSDIPSVEEQERKLDAERTELTRVRDGAQAKLQKLGTAVGAAGRDVDHAQTAIAAAEAIDELSEAAVATRAAAAVAAARALDDARAEDEQLERELVELYAGRPPRPKGLDEFRVLLDKRGITSILLAEQLEVPEALAAEAVLDDGVWALIVTPDRFEETVELARAQSYRLPIVRAGDGAPGGAFSGAAGLPESLAYLAELELPLGAVPGVEADGLVRGRSWAALRAPAQPALGEAARAAAITEREARRKELAAALPPLRAEAKRASEAAQLLRAGVDAQAGLPALVAELERIQGEHGAAEAVRVGAQQRLDELGPEFGRLSSGLEQMRKDAEAAQRRIDDLEPRVKTLSERVAELEQQLAEAPLTPEQEGVASVASVEVLESRLADLRTRLLHFSDEERSALVVAQHGEQEERVAEVELLVADRGGVLEGVAEQVERAKRRYDEHINQTVQNLNRAFREICAQAGMQGELERRPSLSQEDEWALDVRVAHREGESKLSYQHHKHSGGQKAKISILLLLAAMSAEGAADLLIVDEHSAHLDSQNIEYVGEVMRALRQRVQFILALPATAEARRIDWSDQQFAILPRNGSDAYAPPLQLITRLPDPGDRYAEIGRLQLAN
jgi:chromosome segregation ATPase